MADRRRSCRMQLAFYAAHTYVPSGLGRLPVFKNLPEWGRVDASLVPVLEPFRAADTQAEALSSDL